MKSSLILSVLLLSINGTAFAAKPLDLSIKNEKTPPPRSERLRDLSGFEAQAKKTPYTMESTCRGTDGREYRSADADFESCRIENSAQGQRSNDKTLNPAGTKNSATFKFGE